jgi:hypothetical protein
VNGKNKQTKEKKMKSQFYKAALLAALGLAGVSAAQAQTYTAGDLLVGFTTSSGSDLIYDLGQASALHNGETFSGLSTLLAVDFSSLSALQWGVIGDINSGSPRTAYTTTAVGGSTPSTITGSTKMNQINNVMLNFSGDFAGQAPVAGSSTTISANDPNSWNVQTTPNATLSTDYINTYGNPNVTGATSDSFFRIFNNTTAPTLLGGFTLGADDSFTFNTVAVPEPATYGVLAAAGLLLVSLRNQFSRKQA